MKQALAFLPVRPEQVLVDGCRVRELQIAQQTSLLCRPGPAMKQTPETVSGSAGLLLFRRSAGRTEFLLGHPGGSFWAKKDEGAWPIPKGLITAREKPLTAARREFAEEIGHRPRGKAVALGEVDGVAAKVRTASAVSRARPGAVVHAQGGTLKNPEGAGDVSLSAPRGSRFPGTLPLTSCCRTRAGA
jgi:predicted NUDIX family NTP pyrophosphohydrolase